MCEDKIICKICGKELEKYNKGCHFKKVHGITYLEYQEKFNELPPKKEVRKCKQCGKEIPNSSLFCNKKCRDEFYYNERLIENNKLYENKNHVTCRICGFKCTALQSHLQKHKINVPEYMKKFNLQKSDVFTEEYLKIISDNVSGEKNAWYNHGGKYSPFSKNNTNITEEQRLLNIENANRIKRKNTSRKKSN